MKPKLITIRGKRYWQLRDSKGRIQSQRRYSRKESKELLFRRARQTGSLNEGETIERLRNVRRYTSDIEKKDDKFIIKNPIRRRFRKKESAKYLVTAFIGDTYASSRLYPISTPIDIPQEEALNNLFLRLGQTGGRYDEEIAERQARKLGFPQKVKYRVEYYN